MAELIARRSETHRYRELVLELFDNSRRTFSHTFTKIQRKYDLYTGRYSTKAEAGWNNVNVPLLWSVVQSDVARKMQILLGAKPILSFIPLGAEDQEKARRVERLVDVQLHAAKTYQQASRFLITGDLYGTSVWKASWATRYGNQRRRGGGVRPPGEAGSRMLFNGPIWEPVDITDFFPFPGIIDIDEMPGVCHRYYLEFEDIQLGAEPGLNGEDPIYDPQQVALLGETPPSPPINEERMWRKSIARAGNFANDEPWAKITKFHKPVEIIEGWVRVPQDMGIEHEDEYVTDFLVTLADRSFVLNAIPNPHWTRRKPFGAYRPFEDPHFFYAPGTVDIVDKLQIAVNRLANSRLDSLDLALFPPTFYNENSGLDPRQLLIGPGMLQGVDGSVAETEIRQLPPDLRGHQLSFTDGETLWRFMQQGVGVIEDISQGLGQSDRQTAREFVGRKEAVSTRLEWSVRLAEQQFLEPIGQWFHEMNRQYLPLNQRIKMTGSHAVWDVVTGRPVPPEEFEVTVDDMDTDYDVRATGATQALTKADQLFGLQSAAQVLSANPVLASTVNWMVFARQWLSLTVPNVDQIMNTEAQQLQALAAQQVLGQSGPAGPLDQSPFLDQLVGQLQ